jgi:hypothetical protein
MSSKIAGGVLAATVLFLAGAPAAYSADVSVTTTRVYSSSRAVGTKTTLGFWGENFPYGYNWSLRRACQRRVEVETPRGVRLKTVWVCNVGRYAAYY